MSNFQENKVADHCAFLGVHFILVKHLLVDFWLTAHGRRQHH